MYGVSKEMTLHLSLHCNKGHGLEWINALHTQVENGWSTCQKSMKRSPNNFSHHQLPHLWWKTCLTSSSHLILWVSSETSCASMLQEPAAPLELPPATKYKKHNSLSACLSFQSCSSNPVGTCENIMKKGVRTVRSFLRFSAQNLGKRRKEERIKHHNNQHRVNEINEFDRSHLRYLYSHIYFFTIFHITPDHTGSTNSSPSPTIHQTACFAVSCSNCLNSSAQVWRCWTWTKIERKHIKTLERAA